VIPDSRKVYLVLGVTDMRKGIDGLLHIVAGHLQRNILSGGIYVFCSRHRTQIKALYWDRTGFCLWVKRLETDHFPWPKSAEEVMEMDYRALTWLLEGLDPIETKGHQPCPYSIAG
jgi:transposase